MIYVLSFILQNYVYFKNNYFSTVQKPLLYFFAHYKKHIKDYKDQKGELFES